MVNSTKLCRRSVNCLHRYAPTPGSASAHSNSETCFAGRDHFVGTYHAHALGMFEDCSSCPSDPDADAGVCWFVCLLVRGVDLVGDSALTVLLLVPVIRAFHPTLHAETMALLERTIGRRLRSKILCVHGILTLRTNMKTSPSPSWTPTRGPSTALRPAEPPTVVEYIYEISTANDGTPFLQAYPQTHK